MIFRRAMALEAPGHALGLVLIDHFHLVNRATTGKAAYTAVHVHRVIEIGVVRDAVDLYPIAVGPSPFPPFHAARTA
jgi:hypothetical protein